MKETCKVWRLAGLLLLSTISLSSLPSLQSWPSPVSLPSPSSSHLPASAPSSNSSLNCFEELQDYYRRAVFTPLPKESRLRSKKVYAAFYPRCRKKLRWRYNGRCPVPHFDPLSFLQRMRNRTLLIVGDSLSSMFAMNLQLRLQKYESYDDIKDPLKSMHSMKLLFRCRAYSYDVIICSLFAACSREEVNTTNQLEAFMSNMTSSDVVLWNAGVHFKYNALSGLSNFVTNLLNVWNQSKEDSPRLYWRETSAQHYLGRVFVSKEVSRHCIPHSKRHKFKDKYNSATEPIVKAFQVPILRTYQTSLHLNMSAHYNAKTGDCTHYCPENFGPMNFEMSLFSELLRLSLPPDSFDMHPSSRWSINERWEKLLVSKDSSVARFDGCFNYKSSYVPARDGVLPCSFINCIKLSTNTLLNNKRRNKSSILAVDEKWYIMAKKRNPNCF